jgi:hypothetical protein
VNILSNRLDKAGEKTLKKRLLDSISLERGRLDALEGGCPGGEGPLARLRKKLERLEGSLDGPAADGEAAMRAAGELRDLRLAIRGAEIDDAQRRTREESVRSLLGALASANVTVYERELARLEAEFERSASLASDKRMSELQRIMERLQEMHELKDLARAVDTSALEKKKSAPQQARDGTAAKPEITRAVAEIRDWAGRIALMDASEGEKLRPILEKISADSPFPDRLIRIRSQLKRTWGALRERRASSEFFREALTEAAGMARLPQAAAKSAEGAELARRCEELCGDGRKFIERADFMRLYEDIAKFAYEREMEIADDYFVSRMKSALDEMGYELLPDETAEKPREGADIPIRPGEVRYMASPYDGYRVMVKADTGGALSARLVRAVASDEEKDTPGADQRQKDIEAGQKWCRDFDGFLARMRELGLPLETTVRIEPGESPLLAVVDKKRPAMKRRKKAGNTPAERASGAREGDSR